MSLSLLTVFSLSCMQQKQEEKQTSLTIRNCCNLALVSVQYGSPDDAQLLSVQPKYAEKRIDTTNLGEPCSAKLWLNDNKENSFAFALGKYTTLDIIATIRGYLIIAGDEKVRLQLAHGFNYEGEMSLFNEDISFAAQRTTREK